MDQLTSITSYASAIAVAKQINVTEADRGSDAEKKKIKKEILSKFKDGELSDDIIAEVWGAEASMEECYKDYKINSAAQVRP